MSLLFAAICYFVIARLIFLIFFLYLFSLLCTLYLYIVLCTVSLCVLSLSYFCSSLPSTATGWKPNCSKYILYHFVSYTQKSHLRWERQENTFVYNRHPDTESFLRRHDQINFILFLNFLGKRNWCRSCVTENDLIMLRVKSAS